jgi:hypothetical protein
MWSSVEATRKMLVNAQTATNAAELEQARQRGTPKF